MNVEEIKNVCAMGTGAMGSGTALSFAMGGLNVWLCGRSQKSIDGAMENIHAALATFRKHKLIKKSDIPVILGRIKTTTSRKEAAVGADLVIESVDEDLKLKQEIFAELDQICPSHTIFATNTSGLSPTKIAEAIGDKRKKQFVVIHYWNPPWLMPLVEIVPGHHTSPATVKIACQLMQKIGKVPVSLKREAPGFIGNRLQLALLREALHIVAKGIASAKEVDKVLQLTLGLRLPVTGILQSVALGGPHIFEKIFGYLAHELCNETGVPALLQKAVAEGKNGAETKNNIFPWSARELTSKKEQRVRVIIKHIHGDLTRRRNSTNQVARPSQTVRARDGAAQKLARL